MCADAPDPATCCEDTIGRVLATGAAEECPACGVVYLPPDDLPDVDVDARQSEVRDLRPPPLAEVLEDVALAQRWRREEQFVVCFGDQASPLARMQGLANGADADASPAAVSVRWRLLTAPGTRVGETARAGFVEQLVRYLRETTHPDDGDDIDWQRARVLAARLAALAPHHRAALTLLVRRYEPGVAWDTAARALADELAPPELRASWTRVAGSAAVGRPRVNRLAPPPELAALAWGDARLRDALVAWRWTETTTTLGRLAGA